MYFIRFIFIISWQQELKWFNSKYHRCNTVSNPTIPKYILLTCANIYKHFITLSTFPVSAFKQFRNNASGYNNKDLEFWFQTYSKVFSFRLVIYHVIRVLKWLYFVCPSVRVQALSLWSTCQQVPRSSRPPTVLLR